MSGSGTLQPNSGLRYHTDSDSPLPETINPIIDAVETNSENISSLLAGNFSGVVLTDDPTSIADSMNHGEIKLFMSSTASIEGLYGWGIIARRYNVRFITAFAQGHRIYMRQRLTEEHSWTGWSVPNLS